ncbi:hypothetical protein [Staphylococcus cohnii]|uniref:hypothetical protein n=1 Tax=Staphylococcus nepalensis TaxID=214473 RepID=UPI001866FA34
MTGYIYKLITAKELLCDNELKSTLHSLYKINYFRNNLLQTQIYYINKKFENLGIKRLWLKGAREILLGRADLGMHKMVDLDILIDSNSYYLNLNKDLNLAYGTYDRQGEFFNPDQEVIDYALKNRTYEYPAMTKRIDVDVSSLFPYIEQISIKLLNRFRVFWDSKEEKYFTDLILNVHYDLSDNFHNDLILENGTSPTMSDFDDLWYLMYKSYYEIVMGQSKDLQRLIETIIKLKDSSYSLYEIEKAIKTRHPEFHNKELFLYFEEYIL